MAASSCLRLPSASASSARSPRRRIRGAGDLGGACVPTTFRIVLGRGKLLIPRRLPRAASPAAFLSRAPGSPGGSRAEPLLRGSFRKKVDYSNLNCRPEGGVTLDLYALQPPAIPIAPLHPRQFPLRPYSCRGGRRGRGPSQLGPRARAAGREAQRPLS